MTQPNSYDEIPYDSHPFPQTHPDRLATLATLFGLPHPPLYRCRVLELGCAAGGNLIPLAEQLTEGEFVGVDLSAKQIADGQQIVDALGYQNVRLVAASIADVDASWGQFDYIICHGVYSWVPQLIQDRILSICQERLIPDGIAYVSYNTLPGWRMRGMIRDLMRHHALGFPTPMQQVEQARAILDFLAQAVPGEDSAYSLLLKGELELLRHMPDAYIYHEHLETVNEPIYFREFVGRAAQHGLKYLAEADFASMLASRFPHQVAETVQRIAPDIIGQEQLMDFVCNRTFRQSLLIHDHVKVDRNIPLTRIDGCRIASYLSPISDQPDFTPDHPETFKLANGTAITTQTPLTKAALRVLAECGCMSLPWPELLDKAKNRLAPIYAPSDHEVDRLRADLMQCFTAGMVSLHSLPSVFAAMPGDKPCASKLARYQAQSLSAVTNLRHEQVTLDGHARIILGWLDGLSPVESLLNRFNKDYPQLPNSAFSELLLGLARAGLLQINA
jgi:SAM-dependent methyltransferase/methyltransferase-like protein